MTDIEKAQQNICNAQDALNAALILLGYKRVPVASDPIPDPSVPVEPRKFNAGAFYDLIRQSLFNGALSQGQVDGCNLIGTTCVAQGLNPLIEQSAYVMANVYHETAQTMQPIAEYGGPSTRYAPWYGRGHTQLTWEENYEKQQNKLGQMPEVLDQGIPYKVHDDYNLALHPETSALICVCGMRDGDFTGVGLDKYITHDKIDYVNARRIVNGTDRAEQIAGYAEKFEAAIRAGYET